MALNLSSIKLHSYLLSSDLWTTTTTSGWYKDPYFSDRGAPKPPAASQQLSAQPGVFRSSFIADQLCSHWSVFVVHSFNWTRRFGCCVKRRILTQITLYNSFYAFGVFSYSLNRISIISDISFWRGGGGTGVSICEYKVSHHLSMNNSLTNNLCCLYEYILFASGVYSPMRPLSIRSCRLNFLWKQHHVCGEWMDSCRCGPHVRLRAEIHVSWLQFVYVSNPETSKRLSRRR